MEILRNYQGLTHEDIQACLSYASDLLKTDRVYPFEIDGEPLSDEEIKGIENRLEDIKAGRIYSEKEVKKILALILNMLY